MDDDDIDVVDDNLARRVDLLAALTGATRPTTAPPLAGLTGVSSTTTSLGCTFSTDDVNDGVDVVDDAPLLFRRGSGGLVRSVNDDDEDDDFCCCCWREVFDTHPPDPATEHDDDDCVVGRGRFGLFLLVTALFTG